MDNEREIVTASEAAEVLGLSDSGFLYHRRRAGSTLPNAVMRIGKRMFYRLEDIRAWKRPRDGRHRDQ